jgi:hypothetical protein
MLSANAGLTRTQIQQLLQDTADKIEDSVGAYAAATGFSAPATGTPTHAWGRVNAFEAVRIAAPVAQGGKGGVDIFLRDNRLDWGNTEQPSNTLFESTRGYIGHWRSEDIKVDAPPYQPTPTAASFEAFTDETPSAITGDVNKVYVRVRNRGPVTASSVTVKLHWTQFGTALPALPGDFWTAFPANSGMTTQWHPLNCSGTASSTCSMTNLAYSGSSVAGTVGDAAQIVAFDFPAPPVDPMLANHFCLLAMVDSLQDPISTASRSSFVVDSITPTDNNVTHRNYLNLPTDLSESVETSFFVRNPEASPIMAVLHAEAPQGWMIALGGFSLDKPFTLQPKEEVLATIRVTTPSVGQRGTVNLVQQRVDLDRPRVMGGITLQLAPQAAPLPPAMPGLTPYLIGTWDLAEGTRTVLDLVNPTANDLRLLIVFFDDNERPLKCLREKLSPNDLLRLDTLRVGLAAEFGVVKIVAFSIDRDLPMAGIVGNQRLYVRKTPVAETELHSIPQDILVADLQHIWPACRQH